MTDTPNRIKPNTTDTSIRSRRKRNNSFQSELIFHESKDKNGDPFYVSHDIGVDGAVFIDLGKIIFLFFPANQEKKTPPRMIIKPRDFGSEDDDE